METVMSFDEDKFIELHENDFWKEDGKTPVMKLFVGLHYPASICNLRCPYCYLGQKTGNQQMAILPHSPKFVRWCLSQKRLGGRAIMGICGAGETLLGDKIVDVCLELLLEGHYLHIVTNGTVTDKMRELTERAGDKAKQLFFKCSLHYTELKERGLLERYAEGINEVSKMGASYTIELTADDSYICILDEIKAYSMEKFGALPHITIARDDSKNEMPILTELPMNKYYEIWSTFESALFDVKWNYYGKQIKNCDAGIVSLEFNLINGNAQKCLCQPIVGNLFDTSMEHLSLGRVGDDCRAPYCYNNHAYLTLGTCEDMKISSFAQVRDRKRSDGSHWVKSEFYYFINQKLYENNR